MVFSMGSFGISRMESQRFLKIPWLFLWILLGSQDWRLKDSERFHGFFCGFFWNLKDGVSKILKDSIAFPMES